MAELSISELANRVGAEAFEAACAQSMATSDSPFLSDVPHVLSDRLWYDGDESLGERLTIATDLYLRMPCYGNLMYWRHRESEFDEATRTQMWEAYRDFLGDKRNAVAASAAYSLWVDWFEDGQTVDRAWHEVAGAQEPRRPRLERVVSASGPVPWARKAPLYESLAAEGGWDGPLIAGLYGSTVDVYGFLDRLHAMRILRRLRPSADREGYRILAIALGDPALPATGADRRAFVADLVRRTDATERRDMRTRDR